MERKIIKTCGNCKHFKLLRQGYEINNIIDTAYLISKCKIKGWEAKEYYLNNVKMPYVLKDENFDCEYWEEWKPRRKKKRSGGGKRWR